MLGGILVVEKGGFDHIGEYSVGFGFEIDKNGYFVYLFSKDNTRFHSKYGLQLIEK